MTTDTVTMDNLGNLEYVVTMQKPSVETPLTEPQKSEIDSKKAKRRLYVKSIINSLENEDLDSLLIALKEESRQENPLLLAAESGNYKILKSIVEIGPEILDREEFSFADCNEEGENVLHMLLSRKQLNFKDDPEADLRYGIIRYYICAEVLLNEENPKEIQAALRNIVNKQNRKGQTPLYLAAKDWPEDVVQMLLRFGADISIPSNEGKHPLKRIKVETLLEVLNSHCMKSKALLKLGKRKNPFSKDYKSIDNQIDNMNHCEQIAYKKLIENYEPRFMTNIGHSPVKFDYALLAPTRYNRDQLNQFPAESSDAYKIRQSKEPEMEVLSKICESKAHQTIIKHPVVKSWIWLKWNRVRRYYHKELRLDFLLMYLMTWYVIQTFGGYEWTNKCKFKELRMERAIESKNLDWDGYPKNFCDFYDKVEDDLKAKKLIASFGHFEDMNKTNWILYHWGNGTAGSEDLALCMYTKPVYLFYLVLACGMIIWMIADAVWIFSSNPYKRRRTRKSNICFTKVLPILGLIRDFSIIIVVIVFADGMLILVIVLLFLSMLFGEMIQFIVKPTNYLLSPKNWSDITQLILISIIMFVPNRYLEDPYTFAKSTNVDKICRPVDERTGKVLTAKDILNPSADFSVKRGLSAFLIVLSWSKLLFVIANHPSKRMEQFNKYVMMYQTVAMSFMKLLFIYSLFIISFAIGFYILFHEDIGEKKKLGIENPLSAYEFFNTPYESFAKTIAMLIGEVDFNNMPIGISYSRRDGNVSVTLAYLFFLTFIFMAVMVLMNLLNGLAVSDIADIVERAEIKHQVSMINILKEYEDRAINNRTVLDFFSTCLPCLKGFFAIFDYEKELKVFPEEIKPINLPYIPKGKKKVARSSSRKLSWLYLSQRNKKINVGYEHILSEARKILYDCNKSEMNKDYQ